MESAQNTDDSTTTKQEQVQVAESPTVENKKISHVQTANTNKNKEETKESNEDKDGIEAKNVCKTCGKEQEKLLKCGGCQTVHYCSQDCQRKDWKEHKTQCNFKPKPKEAKQPQEPLDRSDLYEIIKVLGEGNFSQIFLVQKKDTGLKYAMKMVNKQRVKQLHKENDLIMEKHCLEKLKDCPYVINLHETFQNFLNLYIVMDVAPGGELWDEVKCFGMPTGALIKYFFAHIVKAVAVCHENGIVHRDLKPENIMLDETRTQIRIVDFGTAKDVLDPSVKPSGNASNQGRKVFQHFVGTPHYMPPECIRNKDSTFKSDVWALGCILYQLYTGFPPFLGASDYLIFTKSLKDDPAYLDFIHWGAAQDLISNMMKRDPEERHTMEDVQKHEYFKDIDWENIGNYADYASVITPEEKLWVELRSKLRTLDENREKEENEKDIEKLITEYSAQVEKLEELDEAAKKRLAARITFAKRQAKAYSNVESFEWESLNSV